MISIKHISRATNNWRILSFCLIILQSIGIRFFDGQGTLLSLMVIALSHKSIIQLIAKDYKFLFFSIFFLLTCKIFNSSFSFSSLTYQIALVISTYLFIVQYRIRPHLIKYEFFAALKLFAYHAFIGYIIFLILPNKFTDFNVMNKSLFYIFYVSTSDFLSIQRNTGIFWEPGVMQLAMNLYLFYCIRFKKNIYHIIIAISVVISSFSTVGLIILIVNLIYFLYTQFNIINISYLYIISIILISILFIPILKENVSDKMSGDNTSGLVRLRDFKVGLDLIKEKPLLGHGKFENNYLVSKDYAIETENDLFTKEYVEMSGDMGGGYTNGLLGLIAWYGIPVSFLLYLFFFKNRFVGKDKIERLLFCSIPLLSMVSEPIAYTSFFLMFPLSYFVLNIKYKSLIK